jgi:hypothetical protein
MRILSLILLVACGPPERSGTSPSEDTGWAPGAPWAWTAVAEPDVLMDALEGPGALALGGESLWVADSSRIWRHDGQDAEVWAEGLTAPTHLAADELGAVIIAGGEVVLLDGEGQLSIASGLVDPQGLALGPSSIWWVDGGTGADGVVMRAARDGASVQTIASGLESPHSLALRGERAVIVEAGNWRVLELMAGAEHTELLIAGGTLRDVAVDCQDVFLAVESTRWPYPGFISSIENAEQHRLGESPPEPDRLRVAGEHLVWSTKQSIHRMDRQGGTFTTVASRSAVADLVVWGPRVIWTNPERGEVLAVGL